MKNEYRSFILVCFLLPLQILAQGKLVLVGGGAESEGGWSDIPYGWIVSNASNKKVAVISYSDEDNFIPDYFISLGAVEAVNIKIDNRPLADLQSTYDLLMEYDAFFFKGGDQSIYYTVYKNTKVTQAIIDKFKEGGVIAGTSAGTAILSGVIFTAVNDSVYPDEALQNFKQSKITLADDFLPLFPGYIFDSHFTERGRGARLLGFMARWFIDTGSLVTGIGVDDRTAFCIDASKIGTVYGTGSVSVYNSPAFSAYQENKPVADSVHAVQLLHGHVYDLEQREILEGPEDPLVPIPDEENGNYQVLLSGSEGSSSNADLINVLVNETGKATDTIAIVTAPGKGNSYRQKLEDMEVPYVVVETSATSNDEAQIELRNAIRYSKKVLFAENDDDRLFDFLGEGRTGALLEQHIRRNRMIVAFMGEDSRYAGKTFVTNHLNDMYAAYYGRLVYERGLGLLRSSVIMSNTYDANDADFYENTTAAVSYAMVADSAKYGIYLNRNSYLRFYQEGGKNYFKAKGSLSALLLINNGTNTAFASQPVNGAGATRQYVGYARMQYALLNGESSMQTGTPVVTEDEPFEFETPVLDVEQDNEEALKIFPNPSVNGIFHISLNIQKLGSITLTDLTGRVLRQKVYDEREGLIDLTSYPDGQYIVMIGVANKILTKKIVKYGSIRK